MADPTLIITPEVVKADGQNRVAKTAGQSAAAGWLLTVALYIAHQAGWKGQPPEYVVVAANGLLTTIAAVATNWAKLRGLAN